MKDIIINEVIGNDCNLISKNNNKPEVSPQNANMSNKTTDYNVNAGRQPMSSDSYMGQMGFNFREDEEKGNNDILDILAELEFEQYKAHVKYFLDNLNKNEIKKYKDILNKNFSELTDDEKKSDYIYAKKMLKAIKSNLKNKKTIEEDSDILNKKSEASFIEKSELKETENIENKFNKITDLLSSKIRSSNDLLFIIKQLVNKSNDDIKNDINFKKQLISFLTSIIENKK